MFSLDRFAARALVFDIMVDVQKSFGTNMVKRILL
jgi:hypothetical protein